MEWRDEKHMNERAKNRGRMAIYAMAGVYLLFMAYNLSKELPYTSGNQTIFNIVFIIFFGVVGAAMVIMGLVQGYKLSRPSDGDSSQELPEPEEDADAKESGEGYMAGEKEEE